jgi:hypothetical protein
MTTEKILTYFAATSGPKGEGRRVQVSLPYISCIADDPHYTEPAPIERREAAPAWSERNVRRMMGRDSKQTARLRDHIKFEATFRRAKTEGY